MKTLSKELIEASVKSKGYVWFENELNIVGIRTKDTTTNVFNDFITFTYKDKVSGQWKFIGFNATTDPGLYWLENPGRVSGTGIMKEGQYLRIWKWDMGHNGYKQFLQLGGPVKCYRDNNRDNYLNMDLSKVEEGYFGCNLHRAHASILQKLIGKYSAMCQVIQKVESWKKVEEIAEKICVQDFYSYTLLLENEIV